MVAISKPQEYKVTVKKYDGGLDMTTDPAGLDVNKVAVSENMRMIRKGFFRTRFGFAKKAETGSSPVHDMHPNSQRDVLFKKTGTKIYCTVDGPEEQNQNWYDTGVVRTASAREVFHDFGVFITASNGTDNFIRLTVGRIETEFDNTDTTIEMEEGHNLIFRTPLTAAFTADSGTDTITSNGHGLSNGDRVAVYNSGGALPSGLSEYTEYFVINSETNTFQLSATYNGSVVDLTTNGTGTNTFTDGIAWCKGKMLTYTGLSGDDLTGARVQSGTYGAGLAITQSYDPAGAKKGTCIYDLDEKILTAGVPGYEDILYYSATSDDSQPELATDFVNYDAGGKRMPSKITCLAGGSGVVLIGLKRGIHFAHSFDIATGALVTRRVTGNYGVPNAHCIVYMDPYYYVFTGKRILQIAADRNGVQMIEPTPDNPFPPFDFGIQSFLQDCDEDQTFAYGYHDPEMNTLIFNVIIEGLGYEVVYDNNNKVWVSVDIGKPFGCRTSWRGRSWAGNAVNGKVYLDDEGLSDDENEINSRILTGEFSYNDGEAEIDFTDFFHTGLLSPLGEFTMRMYVNGKKQWEELITADRLIELGLMSVESGTPIGGGSIGAKSFGHGGDTPDVYNYDMPRTLLDVGLRAQFEFEVNRAGTQWGLSSSKLIGETNEYVNSLPTI